MSITQRITLRYRGTGHLRFEVPKVLLADSYGDYLVDALTQHQGIYRVTHFPHQGKLSIRYFEELTDAIEIARLLSGIALELQDLIEHTPTPPHQALVNPDVPETTDWIDNALEETRETFTAAGIVVRRWFRRNEEMSSEPPMLMLDFFTDALVLYLIKTHWHLITQHWLKRPWLFRYDWMASIYMIYLLVRSKKSKS